MKPERVRFSCPLNNGQTVVISVIEKYGEFTQWEGHWSGFYMFHIDWKYFLTYHKCLIKHPSTNKHPFPASESSTLGSKHLKPTCFKALF